MIQVSYMAELPQWRILYSSQQVWRNWLHGKAQLDFGWNHPGVTFSQTCRLATWFERNKRQPKSSSSNYFWKTQQLPWQLFHMLLRLNMKLSTCKMIKMFDQSLSQRLWDARVHLREGQKLAKLLLHFLLALFWFVSNSEKVKGLQNCYLQTEVEYNDNNKEWEWWESLFFFAV